MAVMEGRARSRISFRRVEGTGSSSQVLRGGNSLRQILHHLQIQPENDDDNDDNEGG